LEARWVRRDELEEYEVTDSACKVINKAFEAKAKS